MAISDTKLRTIHGKPYSCPQEVADADGVSVRISPKGVIQYRYRLHVNLIVLALAATKDARQITSDLRNLYFSGTDPRSNFEEKTQNSLTVAQCLDYWFDNYVSTALREKTQALYRSTVMKRMHDAFPNRPASSITVKQWVDLLTEEERDNPRRARQVLSQLRSAISWCMRRQVIDSCAIMSIQPRDFGSRAAVGDRVLSYNELAQIWMAIERSRASTSNKLLHQMLWGARLSELRLTIQFFDLFYLFQSQATLLKPTSVQVVWSDPNATTETKTAGFPTINRARVYLRFNFPTTGANVAAYYTLQVECNGSNAGYGAWMD